MGKRLRIIGIRSAQREMVIADTEEKLLELQLRHPLDVFDLTPTPIGLAVRRAFPHKKPLPPADTGRKLGTASVGG